VRFSSGRFSASATAFMADYDDFIAQEVVSGSFTPQDPAVYQFININKAEVEGLEGKIDYQSRSGITGRFAIAYANGDQIDSDGTESPLATIDPLSLVAGLGYRDPAAASAARRWSRTTRASHSPAPRACARPRASGPRGSRSST
jgi:hemoglobin/transferrin/lactoferrin receptor protein